MNYKFRLLHIFKRISRNSAVSALFLLVGLLLAACVADRLELPRPPSSLPKGAAVNPRPGIAAWSADGRRLAWLADGDLVILDTKDGRQKSTAVAGATFLRWPAGGKPTVLAQNGQAKVLLAIDPDTGAISQLRTLAGATVAFWWFDYPDDLLTLQADEQASRIGIHVRYSLARLTGSLRTPLFSRKIYYPTRRGGPSLYDGWIYASLQPGLDTFLFPEFHDPPALPSFLRLTTIDIHTGTEETFLNLQANRMTAFASWSPAGDRLAVSDQDGYLVVSGVTDQQFFEPVSWDVRGLAPACNPVNDTIFTGGFLLAADGSWSMELLAGQPACFGFWSPDGRKIAVAANGRLHLFADLPEKAVARRYTSIEPIRKKLRLLLDLRRENLLSRQEYQKRRQRILQEIQKP